MCDKNNIIPYLSAGTSSIIFGLSFIFSKKALKVVDPFTLLSFRFLTASLILTLLILAGVIKVNYKNKPIKYLILLSCLEPIAYFIFETFGIKNSSSSEAGIILALIPIIVAIMSSYFLDEQKTKLQIASIVFSVLGVIFIVLMNSSSSNNSNILGVIFLFGAVMCSGFFSIVSKKISQSFNPIEITYFMMTLSAIFFNCISIISHLRLNTINNYFDPLKNKDFIISISYLGILSSIVAFFLVNFTISKIEVSKSSVFANVSTIVSIIGGVVFLNETFTYYHIIGSIMILTGVWGTNHFSGTINEEIPLTKINHSA